jgi:REP element-mobilizing transposase RayT
MDTSNPNAQLHIRRGSYLPHWTRADGTYAVCFRLADALPQSVVDGWIFERHNIIQTAKSLGRPLSDHEIQKLEHLFSAKVECYLDAGHGACQLRDERCAEIVRGALLHFDGKRYDLAAWCIMPNHVHAIVKPAANQSLAGIMHSWKGFSATRCNALFGLRSNRLPFWQAEYYDHLVRDQIDLENQVRYVLNNPARAGLKDWPWIGVNVAALARTWL